MLYENSTNYSYNNAAIFNSIPSYLFTLFNGNDSLFYSINIDGESVTLKGHVNGTSATGTLTIPETKTFNGITYAVTAIGNSAFEGCNGFTGSLTIPNSVITIGESAFYGCSGFNSSLTIPNSVTTIGETAFYGCSGFTGSLSLPNSVTSIEFGTFEGCSGFVSLTIPNSVTDIGVRAFRFCNGLMGGLSIPNSVTTIGALSFDGCSGLIGNLTIPNSVTTIGGGAFQNCSGFSGNLIISNSLTTIEYDAFSGCSGFTGNLIIPNSVTTIGNFAFEGCSNFTGNLIIPNSVTTIGNFAFEGCSNFTGNLTIPNSVITIGRFAFRDCGGFTGMLTIGNSVTSIGEWAFNNCSGIASIISLPETPPTVTGNLGYGNNSSIPVYVPCGFEEAYSSISWGGFSNFIGLCGGTVTVAASPAEGGIVNGGGSFEAGESCTVTATANANYTFVNWTENGNPVSTNASYTFEVFGDHDLVAHFQPQSFTINVSAEPSNGGTISGGGTYNYGQTCTLTATPASGYTFLRWTKDGTQVSTNASYSFTVTESANYVAHFELVNYVISVSASPSNGGTVSGGGGYHYGENCTVTASVNSGFTFINWTENGQQVSSNPSYTFTVTNDRNLVANFTSQNYVITASADPENGGTITGAGGYNYGETCTLVATSNNGYTFQNWTKNGTQVSTNPSYSFTVTESAYYVAHFNAIAYTISVSASPSEGGFVSGGGSYSFGQSCTVHATANPCYSFVRWTENGSYVSNQLDYSFTVTGNRNLVANFTINTYTITAETNPESAGIVTGSGFYQCGETCTLTVIPNDNYTFLNWTENETVVSNNPSVQFTVTGSRHLVANLIYYNGIDEKDASVELYPNPANDYLSIKGEGIIRVAVFNAVGQVVEDKKVERKDVVQIDVKDYATGIFVIKIFVGDGVVTRRFVKQ